LRFDSGGLWTEFAFAAEYLQSIQAKTPMKTLPETLPETLPKTLPKTPESILHLLRDDPTLTATAIAETPGKSRSAILRAGGKLREEGRLRHVGPRKGGHWEIMEKERI
jgi:predicted HTH transcriptional regulator